MLSLLETVLEYLLIRQKSVNVKGVVYTKMVALVDFNHCIIDTAQLVSMTMNVDLTKFASAQYFINVVF